MNFIFFHRSHRLRPFELSQAWKIHQMKTSATEAKPRQIIFKPLIALNLEASLERLQNLIKVDLEGARSNAAGKGTRTMSKAPGEK